MYEIKTTPTDFTVRERSLDGTLATHRLVPKLGTEPFVRCVLWKERLSTVAALHKLAAELGCPVQALGVAGRKDVVASTYQWCTVPRSTWRDIALPNLKLTAYDTVSLPLTTGALQGNAFRIAVHTSLPRSRVAARFEEICTDGFLNLFGQQRFGPRKLNHVVGEQLLRKSYLHAIELLVTRTGNESAESSLVREQLHTAWPDYEACLTLTQHLPDVLRSESVLLAALRAGESPVRAWNHLPVQARFLVNAYGSHLFNRALAHIHPLPSVLPTLSTESEAWYRRTGLLTGEIDLAQPELPNAKPSPHELPTRVLPINTRCTATETGVRLEFELPKGAYATSLLEQLFTTSSERVELPSHR